MYPGGSREAQHRFPASRLPNLKVSRRHWQQSIRWTENRQCHHLGPDPLPGWDPRCCRMCEHFHHPRYLLLYRISPRLMGPHSSQVETTSNNFLRSFLALVKVMEGILWPLKRILWWIIAWYRLSLLPVLWSCCTMIHLQCKTWPCIFAHSNS